MVDLIAQTPLDGLDVTYGTVRLREDLTGPMYSLAPLANADLGAALEADHGLAWPAPNRALTGPDAQIIWTGPAQAFLVGTEPGPAVIAAAAVTDQTDAWAVMEISGQGAEDVLARLVSVDVRAVAFPVGATARCLLGHMNVSLTRQSDQAMRILVFRSMAAHAAEELSHAMQGVAARSATG